ncbi:unnamed protein product [Auanema sp. JU1783]|nr:unnamed protein product [Auanema sp. JU1783]
MGVVNDYLMFRLLIDDVERKNQKRYRNSVCVPRASMGDIHEPFCSPIVPHVPIRQRLSTRRCTSVDVSDDALAAQNCCGSSVYGMPRRRRMSLLQTLRQQNRALADSGLDIHRPRTDSESTVRDASSPPAKASPPMSPTKKTFSNLKAKLFGKRDKRSESQSTATVYQSSGDYSQSCDLINGSRSRKSPSTTNDSGRGSQGHLEDRLESAVAVIERHSTREEDDIIHLHDIPNSRKCTYSRPIRTFSCPDLSNLHISTNISSSSAYAQQPTTSRAPLVESESEEEAMNFMERNSSPITAADYLIERRMMRKQMEQSEQRRRAMAISEDRLEETAEESEELRQLYNEEDAISRLSAMSPRSEQTEDLADFDDNISTIILDHFLPLSRSSKLDDYNFDNDTLSSEFSESLHLNDEPTNSKLK